MKKILIINTVGYNYDGITSVILNYLQKMDRTHLSFTFPAFPETPSQIKSELEQLGTVVIVPNRKQSITGFIGALHTILKERFDCIHIHGNSGTMLIESVFAKIHGVRKIILHAHSTSTNHPIANILLKYPMMLLADELIACSEAAGNWLYEKQRYSILNNAIDIPKFLFNQTNRAQYREEFGVQPHEYLIGHVGHFTPQKNHFFLLEIFHAYHKLEPNSKLLLLGGGADFERVQAAATELGLQDAVIFAGRRSDIAAIYSAMDLLLLPSRWEGLPLTMLEAQSNSLPMLVSDVITPEAKCTDRTYYKPLTDGAESWANKIYQIQKMSIVRDEDVSNLVRLKGFDIQAEAETLRNIYLS